MCGDTVMHVLSLSPLPSTPDLLLDLQGASDQEIYSQTAIGTLFIELSYINIKQHIILEA